MPFPAFFDDAPRLRVKDPLAEFLGAPADGVIDYCYADAVRLAGHSCPTVAGAWLMTVKAMAKLWPEGLPERGAVTVLLDDPQDEGVTGVMGAVAGLVTGAAGAGGFKGIAGRFGRDGLLRFGGDTGAVMTFRRTDTGAGVQASYHPELVPADPEMRTSMHKVLVGYAEPEDRERFSTLWQDRVRRILVEHADDPGLVRLAAIC